MRQPPIADRREHQWTRPTGDVDDPYAWLSDRDDTATIAYLEAENEYSTQWFDQHQTLVDTIYDEIRSRVRETDEAAPVPTDLWWYGTRTEEGASYPIHTRGHSATTATEYVILDQNHEAAGHEYFDIGAFDISPDHRLLAWSIDLTGDEHYTLRIRDLDAGVDLADTIEDTTWAGSAWSLDGTWLFYVVADEQERPYRVMRHRVGTDQDDDVAVFTDDDERFFVGVGLTRSERWIVIHSASKTSAESWLIPATDPTAEPRLVRERRADIEYQVDDWGDELVIVTNDEATDFRVMTTHPNTPAVWTELIGHVPGRRITGVEPFADFLAIHEWFNGQPRVVVVDRDGNTRPLDIDPEPHDVEFGPNEIWSTSTIRLTHQSLTTPLRTIDVSMTTGEITVVRETPTPNVDLDSYVASRRWTTTVDGKSVPVDLVHHVDTPLDGSAPCVVYGYGAYEASMPPWFSVGRLSLLDRGAVWALVHPRGGGELGREWYLDGKLANKMNTFTDTLAVCDDLVDARVAAGDRLALRGGSAGGLLVGACVTMRPERFASAVAEVPFVDVVTTMSDPSLPLTVTEWEEWGDPRTEPDASRIAAYSPYDNTTAADYPAMYITAGLNDPRVSFHEPAKWTARLRAVNTGDRPILLRTEMGTGHGGPSGRYESWRDEARVLTFLLVTLGLNDS